MSLHKLPPNNTQPRLSSHGARQRPRMDYQVPAHPKRLTFDDLRMDYQIPANPKRLTFDDVRMDYRPHVDYKPFKIDDLTLDDRETPRDSFQPSEPDRWGNNLFPVDRLKELFRRKPIKLDIPQQDFPLYGDRFKNH